MVRIDIEYEGALRTRCRHEPSGSTLTTDAPTDNHGKGEAFSPTDLLATSLGTCMITVMGIAAAKASASIDGARVTVNKHMTNTLPRRVARLEVLVWVPLGPDGMDAALRATLEHAGETCPVRLSLSNEITVSTRYGWGGPREAGGPE